MRLDFFNSLGLYQQHIFLTIRAPRFSWALSFPAEPHRAGNAR
jgi:hypothetical protein